MARRRASEFLLACERGHSALFQSLDFFSSSAGNLGQNNASISAHVLKKTLDSVSPPNTFAPLDETLGSFEIQVAAAVTEDCVYSPSFAQGNEQKNLNDECLNSGLFLNSESLQLDKGLYTYGKSATQLSKHSSVFKRGPDSWKCCFRPSHFWAIQKHKTFELNKSGSFHHRLFSSTGTHTKRNPSFSTLNPDDVRYFKEILGKKNVIQDEDRLLDANVDWMRKYKGSSQLLLLPRNTEEVSKILKYCNSRCLPVVPQGGNTGLVGGSVPVYDEVIINLSSMDNIISLNKISGILVCEAGCILENLNSFLANEGYVMPLDLGAKGSCQIGGNVSTNAGGLHFIRYGSLHENILGLEVILADGTILDMLTTLRKDNTGYDLKHLFIGNEGTLGIITKVAVLTPCKLSSTNTAFLSCNDFASCQKLLGEAKRNLGESISAFEFMDQSSVELALTYIDGTRNPLPASLGNFYVLVETIGTEESYDRIKLETFLSHSMDAGFISDGVIAQDLNQSSSFWRIREGISEATVKEGAVYKYDLSLPVENLYGIVEEMRARLGKAAKVMGYGHLGDGNLHLNITATHYDDKIFAKIEPFVYEWTSHHRGSISAEHGLGLMKAEKIHYSKSAETVKVMASIKKMLDPKGILNPYKVLPQCLL